MLNKILKFIIGTALGLAVALLVAFNALLLWVATGPRSLDKLSPYIAASFKTPNHEFSIKIDHTLLIWDGWKHPVDIRLKDVTVLTKQGQVFSTFPQISVGIDIWSLLGGRILPTSLTITHPSISLFQNADRSISFGFHEEEKPAAPAGGTQEEVPFADVVAPLVSPGGNNSLSKLHFINILNADVSIASAAKGVFFRAGDATILFRRDRKGESKAAISATISYGASQSLVEAEFTAERGSPRIDGELRFSQLMPGTLAALFSDNKALLAARFPLSGSSKLSLDVNGTVQRVSFIIDGGRGMIASDYFEKPLDVDGLHVEGKLSNNATDIQIDTLTADINGSPLSAQGVVSLGNNDLAVRGHAGLHNVEVKDVHLLWPPSLSPESRQWVTANISGGRIISAEVHADIPFGDLAKPQLPKNDISGTVALEGVKIRYLPEHPEVTHINGTVHVDAVSLTADIQSADFMKDTKISNGKAQIDDLNADNPYIKVGFNADASVKDMVKLLSLPPLKQAAALNLHENSAAGRINGHADLGFHFLAPKENSEDDVAYAINVQLKNVATPQLLHKFDIENANGSLALDNKGLEFKGGGGVNGASVSNADVRYVFSPENGLDTFIAATATAPVDVLPRFGLPKFSFLKGSLSARVSLKIGQAIEQSQAAIDLTNAALTFSDISLDKKENEPATLDIAYEKKADVVTIPSFLLKGKNMEVHGEAALNADLSGIKHVEMDKMRYGAMDLDHVLYEPFENGSRIEASGRSADLSGLLEGGGDSFSFEHFPALELKASVDRVVLGKDRAITAVKGDVNCDEQLCQSANVKGKTADGKPFAFLILRNPKGMRQLSLHAQGAGAFIKAVGIFGGMTGGDLTITGNYRDKDGAGALKGRIDITAYTVHDAPVLARILSLASLTGFFDMLQGNGIHFDRLTGHFTLSKDVITFTDAKTHGDAIGMTAEGTITFPKEMLDLKGAVVPSYTLNHVLGNVPLVGGLLTGGDGGGVFAARYSVSGSVDKPDVSVNPLSMLTPGFLRGVFDIFDTTPDAKE